MYLFYSIMILLGVGCVSLSMIMLMIDRRRAQEISNNLDTKKEDIIEVINDAEQIVVEMNNFSDYLFEKIDLKAKEIDQIIENAQRKVKEEVVEQPIFSPKEEKEEKEEKAEIEEIVEELPELSVVNGSSASPYITSMADSKHYQTINKKVSKIDVRVEGTQIDLTEMLNTGREKIIPINPKHRNVYTLLEKGYSEIEIAKMLKIGMGEIKLILGVKR